LYTVGAVDYLLLYQAVQQRRWRRRWGRNPWSTKHITLSCLKNTNVTKTRCQRVRPTYHPHRKRSVADNAG